MVRRILLSCTAVLVVVLLGLRGTAQADSSEQDSGPVLDVRVGFDGYVQGGAWAPINVIASNDAEDISGELRVVAEGLGTGRAVYTRPIDLPRGSRKQVTLYIADVSSFSSNMTIELVRRGRVLTAVQERVQYIPSSALLIGLLTDSPQPLADLALVKPTSGESKLAYLTVEDLPPLGQGWRSLDVLVISDFDTGQLSDEQRTAMQEWVLGGGRLLIAGGPAYQRTLAGLGEVSPITVTGTQTVSLQPLTEAAGSPLNEQIDPDALVATGTLSPDAVVVVESENTPLVVSRPLGHGRVDFLAADPGLEPLRSWDAMDAMWTMILAGGEGRPGWAYGFAEQWEAANNAASAIPGIRLPSALAMCGFLSLYVILIGPVNYFILWRLKRRELAWVTIPALVILFSVLAYVTGFQLRGSQAVVHRLAVIQTWPGAAAAKVDTLVGMWSPRRSRYDIQIEPGYLVRPMPAPSFGGGLTNVGEKVIEEGEMMLMRGVQVDVGSVQTFVVEGYSDTPPQITGELALTVLGSGNLRVEGEITNNSQMDLSRVTLIVAGQPQRLTSIPAGETLEVNERFYPTSAAPAGGLAFDPFPWSNTYNSYYYGGYTALAPSIVQVTDCWSGTTDQQRECNLLGSIMNAEWSGSGIYLFGWAEEVPVDMQVLNASSRMVDEALVIAKLPDPSVEFDQNDSTVTPGLMTWNILDYNQSAGYVGSPYDFYLSSSSPVVFRFEPIFEFDARNVTTLLVNLDGEYGYSTSPRLWIRNFTTGRWEELASDWGVTRIENPAGYLDQYGGVELRIQAAAGYDTPISRFDVTLLGE